MIYARFMAAGKPLLMEEMGHAVSDPEESLRGTVELAEALSEHVSGLQIWFLSDVPKNDQEWHYGPLGADLRPNAWGAAWKKLAEPGGLIADLSPSQGAGQDGDCAGSVGGPRAGARNGGREDDPRLGRLRSPGRFRLAAQSDDTAMIFGHG